MLMSAALTANAQSFTSGGLKYEVTDSKTKTARVVDEENSQTATSYNVPANIVIAGVTYTVNSIGEEAFKWSTASSITLPETIDSIYDSAFNTAKNLTSIKLPNKLKYIGGYVFGSSGLTSIEIPASVEEIGYGVFFTCKSLTTVKFNEGLSKMGESTFYNSAVTNVTLPESLVEIPAKVFLRCQKLESVKLSSKAISMGDAVFNDCPSLKSVTLPSTLLSMGDEMFLGCTSLSSISIPAKVEKIGTSLIAKSGVATITVDAANKNFHVLNGILYSMDNRLLYAVPQKGMSAVVVNSKCIGINGGAFWGSEVKNVTLPKGMLAIDDYAFCQSALETINFPASLVYIGEQGFASTKLSGELTLPVNMPYVFDGAFAGNKLITSLVFPSGVKSIANHAFLGCEKLASITCLGSKAPEIETAYEDYDQSFYGCAASSVTVPKDCSASYKSVGWSDYFTVKESDMGVFKFVSTSPVDGSFYSAKWADMAYDIVFDEPITIIQKNPEAILREGDEVSEIAGKVLEPDDAWYATSGSNKNTLRIWGADYDMYTCTFSVNPAKAYTMIIPAGVVKNAAGETNERIVISVSGSDPTGVAKIELGSGSTTEVARYNLNGQKVDKSHKGVTIIKMSDGTSKKVVVK